MDTKEITLTLSDKVEMDRLFKHWYGRPPEIEFTGNMAKIITPLQYLSYRELLEEFVQSRHADKISVVSNGTRKRFLVKRFTPEEFLTVEKMVKEDKIKRGHLELQLEFNPVSNHPIDKKRINYIVEMLYTEKDGILSCFRMRFGYQMENKFNWEKGPSIVRARYIALSEIHT